MAIPFCWMVFPLRFPALVENLIASSSRHEVSWIPSNFVFTIVTLGLSTLDHEEQSLAIFCFHNLCDRRHCNIFRSLEVRLRVISDSRQLHCYDRWSRFLVARNCSLFYFYHLRNLKFCGVLSNFGDHFD